MTLTTPQGISILAGLAVASALWAAHVTVNSATRGADWALGRLPGVFRWSLVAGALGVMVALIITPGWIGLGIAYLAGVVAWTARSVVSGLKRIHQAGGYQPLPINRQVALVGRAGLWLLIVAAIGVGVALIDLERRGADALFDFVLVAVVGAAGVVYRRKANSLDVQ